MEREWDKLWANEVVLDELESTHFKWESHRKIMKEKLPEMIEEGSSVLDIGCGFGHWYEALKDIKGVDYLGVDYSKEMIERAKKRYPDARFMVGDAYKLKFADKSFDYVLCFDVLRHLRFYEEVIKEMNRVGKTVIMTVFMHDGEKQEWKTSGGDKNGYIVQCYNEGEVDGVVKGLTNNFSKETIHYHNVGDVKGRFMLYVLVGGGR